MSRLVVDASVIARCVLPEEGSDQAKLLVAQRRPLIAPDLILSECANAIWKLARREALNANKVEALLGSLMLVPLMRLPLRPLTADALHLASQHDHPVYDCYYLAAAILNDCELATADKRLAALAHEVGIGDRVILIGAGRKAV